MGNGAPWHKGEDRWRPGLQGLDQEQVWPDCEQEAERQRQEALRHFPRTLEQGREEGTPRVEGQGLRRDQEGHSSVQQGKGVPQPVSAAHSLASCEQDKRTRQLQLWGFPQLLSVGA